VFTYYSTGTSFWRRNSAIITLARFQVRIDMSNMMAEQRLIDQCCLIQITILLLCGKDERNRQHMKNVDGRLYKDNIKANSNL
jgi:hypothetical protein